MADDDFQKILQDYLGLWKDQIDVFMKDPKALQDMMNSLANQKGGEGVPNFSKILEKMQGLTGDQLNTALSGMSENLIESSDSSQDRLANLEASHKELLERFERLNKVVKKLLRAQVGNKDENS